MDGGITRIGTMADKETLSASSSSPTNSSTSKTTRKRKFAAKVRTGCDNCKRRRVKCDERKPECLRCLRTGIQCSGYAISEPKVFQPSTVPRSAQTQFSIIDIRPIERDTQFTFSRLINEQGLQLLAKSYYSLHKVRLSSVPYSTAEKQAAFGFYLSCIAPMLAGYGPNGDFWSVLIPQFTFQSPTIRNLVLAAVTIDKKWLLTVRNRQTDHKAQALTYYTTALKAMASGQTNKVEAVVGALMAWTIEAMLFDYTSGAVHLHAARCMLAEVEAESSQTNDHGTYDLASKSLRQALGLAQCYNTIMLSSSAVSRGAHNHSYLATQNGFVSLRTIRSNLSCRLTKAYEDGIGDPARFLRFLNGWENADRANRYHGKESQILKEANHLLFNIACALLPPDAAYGISHDTDEKTVHYVLARVHAAIQERFKLVKAEQEILDEILADVLGHLFRLFPQWERWTRHNNLIEELHAQYPAVLRQTGLLDKVKTKGKGMASSVVG